jgi:general secretion pathway protein K
MTRQRGFALLLVLWTMGFLALLVAQFTSAGRTETRVAANLRANAAAEAAADGGLHEAILRLLQGVWLADDRPRLIRVEDAVVEIRITNQATKVNPNNASVPVIQALLTNIGVDPGKAPSLARAIVDWRSGGLKSLAGGTKLSQYQAAALPYGPANKLFDSVEEVGQVVGMTPALLARIRPFLSVYQEGDAPSPDDSLGGAPEQSISTDREGWYLGSTGRVMVVAVKADAVGAKGGRFTRQAIVRLRAEPSLDQAPYQILTWETAPE